MKKLEKLLVGAAVCALAVPALAQADEQDMQRKIEELTKKVQKLEEQKGGADQKKIEDLTRKVDKIEEKSLGKWLTIGGDYRFRLDSLNGSTKAYTDAFGSLNNAQNALQGTIFGGGSVAGQPVSQLMPLVQTMQHTTSYAAAAGMVRGLMSPLPPGTPANIVLQQQLAGMLMTPAAAGGYAIQVPAYKPNNDTLYTNRFGLNIHAKATKDVTVNVRLLAYKTFGSNDDQAVTNGGATPFFADRVGVFDGTLGRVPSSDFLNVDRAYATWSNIAEQPIWFSIGRRPSTEGAPSNLRLNNERPGNGGTPALLVDYAFDGMTLGWAPDIEALPGAYAKICYGRGFEAGFETPANNLKDTDMLGLAIVPVDTDPLRVWLQYNRGFNIFDFPTMNDTYFGNTAPAVNLGAIDWYGLGAMSTIKKVGPGNINFFGDVGMSVTHPNNSVSGNAGFEGLMTGAFFNPEAPTSKTGWATYVGARYDYEPTKTKFGVEYNHGSKNWITFAPAADDMWTAKVGTRGDVYETYLIQELNSKPVSSFISKAFFRIGFQYYDFEYTGSNNWVGAPVKISSIQPGDMMLMAPVKSARDIYATLEVKF
ncbi:protein of unknown function DUF3373 [Citrifermentans bemidjiense Bem]|uniref:DUF3373 domain-containing protein n=1 Tax=Citrifermentans bemidjiense (strain ATCC BAA-1014 / DSM 16622 / JCM 12645 / Bem) TaxID=404380 RepID=B5EE48_CITBB|nr:DUF3373 domain-containing protein [Citrifermentans bemidjiense]ACH37786.1 protein of unknown function DUF3373 [Citrifermentans bemidjiense Bem]